jgi:biotin synthase
VKENANFEVYGFFGPLSRKSLFSLKEAGMDGYWCGIEAPNKKLFKEVRPGDNFNARIETLKNARDMGMKTWSSFIYGLGETQDDIVYGLKLMKELGVTSVSIQAFTPRAYTEMEKVSPPNVYEWAKLMAITRIYLNDIDLFTPTDSASWGLRAGANGFIPFFSTVYTAERNKADLDEMRKAVYAKDRV